MKKLFKLTLTLLILNTFYLIPSNAQVGINNDNSEPDASAMLDVKSDSKGMLVPRMSSNQRTMINSPATGLLVFDTDTESFWFKDATTWIELVSGNVTTLSDADGDTQILVDDGSDQDSISFNLAGTEYFAMKQGRIDFLNTGRSVLLGFEAGMNDDFSDNRNVAMGEFALRETTTGRWNTALGYSTMRNNEVGQLNVAVGFSALSKVTANDNTAVGGNALTQNIAGTQNTALGSGAGQNNQGSGNLFLGYEAGKSEGGDNKLYIENSDTTAPLIYGEFDNDLVRINGDLEVTGSFPQRDRIISTNNTWRTIANSGKISISDEFSELFAFSNNAMNLNVGINTGFGNTQRIQFNDGSENNQISNVFPSIITIPPPNNADYLMRFKVRNDTPLTLKGDGSVEINEAYTLPTMDGTVDQILATDGSGNTNWTDLSSINSFQTKIEDSDGNTKIQVEESTNDNRIRLDIDGIEVAQFNRTSQGDFIISPNSNNIIIGNTAGTSNTGGANIFIGEEAGRANTTGGENVFVGDEAGKNITTSSNNVFVGNQAGLTSDASSNVYIGSNTAALNSSGTNNVLIGTSAGQSSSGSGNIFLGFRAGRFETGSNRLYIHNGETTDPLIYGEFDNNFLRVNGSFNATGNTTLNGTLNAGNTTVGNLKVGSSGSTISTILKASISRDVGNINGNNGRTETFSVTGAAIGGVVHVSPRTSLGGQIVIAQAWVSSGNTVSVRFRNTDGGGQNPPNTTYDIVVIQ